MTREPKTFHIGNDHAKCKQVAAILNALQPMVSDDIEVVLRTRVKDKTHEQRKLWHALLTKWGAELGYNAKESTTILKDFVKLELLGEREVKVGETVRKVPQSSEAEDKYGYSELIEKTIILAATHGYVIGVDN